MKIYQYVPAGNRTYDITFQPGALDCLTIGTDVMVRFILEYRYMDIYMQQSYQIDYYKMCIGTECQTKSAFLVQI